MTALRESLKRLTRSRSSLFGNSSKFNIDEADLPQDPEFKRHLAGEDGNVKAALKRWAKTQQWRVDNKVEGILERPHPNFDLFKRYYPHYYAGRTKEGRLLYVERLTEVNLKALRSHGLMLDDLINHYVYMSEYQTQVVSQGDGKTVTILDVNGLRFSQVIGDVVQFAKRVAKIAQEHYPERAHMIFILNVPLWFNAVYKIIKPLLAAETLAKIKIFRSGYKKALLAEIDAEVLPSRYGGNNANDDYENEMEVELRKFVMRRIDATDSKMLE